MIHLERTNPDDKDFIELVNQLDAYLAIIDGDEHLFYAQFNALGKLKCAVVAYENGKPVGCGALKVFDQNTMEIKRMYTLPKTRGKGIASAILSELEKWANELSANRCILETGEKQIEALALYLKFGYKHIPNYGQYIGVANSICFEKELSK